MITIQSATASVLNDAMVALKRAVREDYVKHQIPLNTPYDVKVVSDLDNPDEPIRREVWVKQTFPVKREFCMISEELKVRISAGKGAELEQNLTHHDPE